MNSLKNYQVLDDQTQHTPIKTHQNEKKNLSRRLKCRNGLKVIRIDRHLKKTGENSRNFSNADISPDLINVNNDLKAFSRWLVLQRAGQKYLQHNSNMFVVTVSLSNILPLCGRYFCLILYYFSSYKSVFHYFHDNLL